MQLLAIGGKKLRSNPEMVKQIKAVATTVVRPVASHDDLSSVQCYFSVPQEPRPSLIRPSTSRHQAFHECVSPAGYDRDSSPQSYRHGLGQAV